MSIWDEKYQEDYTKIQNMFPFINKREYINESMQTFVGTLSQIKAEQARLEEQFNKKVREERCIIGEEVAELLNEYYKELYEPYIQYPKELCDMAYGKAYEQSHSYGYSEVEGTFTELVEYFIKAYELGMRHDK